MVTAAVTGPLRSRYGAVTSRGLPPLLPVRCPRRGAASPWRPWPSSCGGSPCRRATPASWAAPRRRRCCSTARRRLPSTGTPSSPSVSWGLRAAVVVKFGYPGGRWGRVLSHGGAEGVAQGVAQVVSVGGCLEQVVLRGFSNRNGSVILQVAAELQDGSCWSTSQGPWGDWGQSAWRYRRSGTPAWCDCLLWWYSKERAVHAIYLALARAVLSQVHLVAWGAWYPSSLSAC